MVLTISVGAIWTTAYASALAGLVVLFIGILFHNILHKKKQKDTETPN